jgi:phosphoribosylformimino-5-aminoimidazole carboxamide ribotide isomerase
MIAAPAIDLREGRCVQLVGGDPSRMKISLPDPADVAERWWRRGFTTLHLVDLDAALGSGDNLALLKEVIASTPARTQVGGGIRDDARAEALLAAGADRIVVGTRALDDPDWLEGLAVRHPGRVMVAADTRDGVVLRRGWTEVTGFGALDLLSSLATLPLAGILATDVAREGRLDGIDRLSTANTVRSTGHPVWISGGVTTEGELAFLEAIGAAGAVLGMALYADVIDVESVARRWGAPFEEKRTK